VPTRHEEIAETLTEEILRGRYRPGDRLPSERDLSTRFDANRGAVREAIKKLEQLGLADVQPGGARVVAVEDASLEVLGHLMTLNDIPDVELVEQMMEVMESLMSVAVKGAVSRASDQEIAQAQMLIRRLQDADLDQQALVETRLQLFRQFMRMSGNLVLILISGSLRISVLGKNPNAHQILYPATRDLDTYLQQMDRALESRDAEAVAAALKANFELNRDTVLTALREAHAANGHANGARRAAQ
jgi:GntR family transcriptional repressor for pyruvate dehydrogenase complex